MKHNHRGSETSSMPCPVCVTPDPADIHVECDKQIAALTAERDTWQRELAVELEKANAKIAALTERLKFARFVLAGLPSAHPTLVRSTVLHQALGLIDQTLDAVGKENK